MEATKTTAAQRGDMIPRLNTGTTDPIYWSIVSGIHWNTAHISRRGSTCYVDAIGIGDRVVRTHLVERLTFEACAELPHPTSCPECAAPGNWNITLADHDRLWCQDCGHQWEVPLRVMDDADLSVCCCCSVAIISDGPGAEEMHCELCHQKEER